MRDREHALARLATRQHGVVSLRQLAALGFDKHAVRRRVKAARLHRLHRGVYAVGHRRLTTRGRWMAAVLRYAPGAVLSHRAALALWGLRPTPAGPIDVTVVGTGRRSPRGIRLHCTHVLAPSDVTIVDAIPVTTVARAVLDYAPTATPQQLRTVLEAAERLELLDGDALNELLDRSPGRATTKLRRVLNDMTDTVALTRSELERIFLELVREAGLPEPQVNMHVAGADADFYWPAANLVVEGDSWGFHRSRTRFEADRRLDTQRALAGIRTIRLTHRRIIEERTKVQAELNALLDRPNLL